MKFEGLIKGRFVKRYKRFFMDCRLENGEIVIGHCPNTGSMKSLLDDENFVYMLENDDPKKKLKYACKIMEMKNGSLACIDTHLPNKIVYDGINEGLVKELMDFKSIEREKKYGNENSKIDILLTSNSEQKIFVEVKNVTLIEDNLPNVAQFPDSVSLRGAKHLRELANEVKKGNRAIIFYLVNRSDGESFKIAEHIDEKYKEEFDKAVVVGVEVLIYKSKIEIGEDFSCNISIDKKLDLNK
ncbi:MAG: DNA/RNA nuclease SfsA [Nanoarchaeota archaeon]|nr:DNA/RNA nuclease SfsA [Nanoarchaeota archaeon]